MIFKNLSAKKFFGLYLRHEYVFAVCFVLIWQVYLICQSQATLSETDNFTHALRLADFISSGSWAETMYMHDNWPFGQMLHFTRITDMFLFATSLPFLPFTDVKQAVFYGCFLYQPLIAGLSAAGLIWAGKAFFGPVLRILAMTLYFCQFPVLSLFTAGRADHHVLLNLLIIITVGGLMHGFKTGRSAFFKTAGIFAGLYVWATPEGFLAAVAITAGMVLSWLFKYQNMRQIRIFCQYFFLTSAVCLIVNPPMQGILFPDNGRLSVLLVVISGLMALSFYMEEFLEKEKFISSFIGRFLTISLLSLFSLGFALFLFGAGKVFGSPIPPELYEIWAKHITELQPAFLSNSAIAKFDGIPLLACVLGLAAFPFAPPRYKKLIMTVGAPVLFFTFMTLLSRRFGRTVSVFAALMTAAALNVFYSKSSFLQKESVRIFLVIPAIFYLLCSFLYLTAVSHDIQSGSQMTITRPEEYLPYISKEKGSILTSSSRGPETAWGAGIPVIGSPYHSNAEGITDTYNILYGTDPIEVQKLLKKHQVKTILLDNPYYYLPQQLKEKLVFNPLTFVGKLLTQKYEPCFLKQIRDLPSNVQQKYIIFHVDFKACEKLRESNP